MYTRYIIVVVYTSRVFSSAVYSSIYQYHMI